MPRSSPRRDSDAADPRLVWLASVFAGAVFVLSVIRADATWKPEYANADPAVQDWYRNAELTPEARKRFPFTKCCDHADVVKTKFTVNKTDHGDEWLYQDLTTGEWKRVPPDIIHWGESAPGGEPTLFVYHGRETCFFPGGENNN